MSDERDYELSIDDATFLATLTGLSAGERQAILFRRPRHQLARLFAEFIGLANSVTANNRSSIEMILTEAGVLHANVWQTVNLPSIDGALAGVENAVLCAPADVCDTCAFRLGSAMNQCQPTARDASDALEGEHDFMCHQDMTADGQPQHKCRGYVAVMKLKRSVIEQRDRL